MTTRAAVVAEAREWIGTKHAHHGRTKGVGVDCAGLVIGVARALRLVPLDFDISGYALRPDGTLLDYCARHMHRIPQSEMQPGDVIVVAFGREPQHLGILGDYAHGGLSIIHAFNQPGAGRVVETRLLLGPQMRFVAAFRLPGIEP